MPKQRTTKTGTAKDQKGCINKGFRYFLKKSTDECNPLIFKYYFI